MKRYEIPLKYRLRALLIEVAAICIGIAILFFFEYLFRCFEAGPNVWYIRGIILASIALMIWGTLPILLSPIIVIDDDGLKLGFVLKQKDILATMIKWDAIKEVTCRSFWGELKSNIIVKGNWENVGKTFLEKLKIDFLFLSPTSLSMETYRIPYCSNYQCLIEEVCRRANKAKIDERILETVKRGTSLEIFTKRKPRSKINALVVGSILVIGILAIALLMMRSFLLH